VKNSTPFFVYVKSRNPKSSMLKSIIIAASLSSALAYSVCDTKNYPYAGQKITIPLKLIKSPGFSPISGLFIYLTKKCLELL
jgi:hypothetical protein